MSLQKLKILQEVDSIYQKSFKAIILELMLAFDVTIDLNRKSIRKDLI